jgi:hypothetical protein
MCSFEFVSFRVIIIIIIFIGSVYTDSGVFRRGGGIVPWPPPLADGNFFFEGLEDRWTGGWPPLQTDLRYLGRELRK